jgi:hypothetical protein
MKYFKLTFFFLGLTLLVSARTFHLSRYSCAVKDTMPDICSILTGEYIDGLKIYTNPITKVYPESYPIENFAACYYEFFKPNDYPTLSVQLNKFKTKQEAGVMFLQNEMGHYNLWGVASERILHVADSVSFTQNVYCSDKCVEGALVVASGRYVISIIFKAQENTLRDREKEIALKILEKLFDTIPGLGPQYVRVRQ